MKYNLITYFHKKKINEENLLYYGPINKEVYEYGKFSQNFKLPSDILQNDKKRELYLKCEETYKKLIKNLARELNYIHSSKLEVKIWEIIFGRWIKDFIYICYRNYNSIQIILKKYNIEKVYCLSSNIEDSVTNNWLDLINANSSISWNNQLNYKIIESLLPKNKIDLSEKIIRKKKMVKSKKLLQSRVLEFYNNITKRFKVEDKFFFYQSGLDFISEKKIELALNQLPSYWNFPEYTFFKKIDAQMRNKLNLDFNEENSFEVFLKKILKDYLPLFILESFDDMMHVIKKLNFPKKIKFLLTGTGFTNELFNIFLANSLLKKKKYILVQHGNAYKTHYENDFLTETQTCDYFMTWGIKEKENEIQIFNIKTIRKKKTFNKNGNFSVISHMMSTRPLPFNSFFYQEKIFKDTILFLEKLPIELKNKTYFRLFPNEKFNSILKKEILNKNINLYPENISFEKIKNRTKLFMFNYDSTGFYENLSLNIPTIFFSKIHIMI